MAKQKTRKTAAAQTHDLRLEPEQRVCPKFDAESIARFPLAKPGEMGFRVLDNAAEENIQ